MLPRISHRRGVTSMLAMMYLVLFATLAVGFYASTNTSAIVSSNEQHRSNSLMAAESGMEYTRFQLAGVRVPATKADSLVFTEIYNDLATLMNGTANLTGKPVVLTGTTIRIPQIKLYSNGDRFTSTITQLGKQLQVTVRGYDGKTTAASAVQISFQAVPVDASILDYGIASLGKVRLGGDFDLATDTQEYGGSILSASSDPNPLEIKKEATISGDVSFVNAAGTIKIGSKVTIAGSSDPAVYASHIHAGVPMPEFPSINVSAYKPFATNILTNAKIPKGTPAYFNNIIVPPGTNPKFTDGAVLEGIIYVQMPNIIVFDKSVTVRGVIVYEPAAGFIKEKDNHLEFKGSGTFTGMDTLPVNATFPKALHDLGYASIIAPQTDVKFTGSSNATIGTIVTDDLKLDGHANMLLTGNVITFGETKLEKKASLNIVPPPAGTPIPSALRFTTRYAPVPYSYDEVKP
ncbi:MAG TPA: hypothetical protein VGQ99_11675 [Tepidisphaeraceae bacterium]|jgi:Tfp pilus assembly protein PilX|nr:hypothetical protein [Tepidisphaeraceae bacterium]